jgi:hypothetical protein
VNKNHLRTCTLTPPSSSCRAAWRSSSRASSNARSGACASDDASLTLKRKRTALWMGGRRAVQSEGATPRPLQPPTQHTGFRVWTVRYGIYTVGRYSDDVGCGLGVESSAVHSVIPGTVQRSHEHVYCPGTDRAASLSPGGTSPVRVLSLTMESTTAAMASARLETAPASRRLSADVPTSVMQVGVNLALQEAGVDMEV